MELVDPITDLNLVGEKYRRKLEKLGVTNIESLFLHVPTRYLDFTLKAKISTIRAGEIVTIAGKVESMKNVYTKTGKIMQIAKVSDDSGTAEVIWFNQPYLVRAINESDEYSFSGKVGFVGRKIALVAPEYEKIEQKGIHTGRLVPIYPETAGLSSKWLRRRILDAYEKYKDKLADFLPKKTLKNYSLVEFKKAIFGIHFPKTKSIAHEARKRLAFNELLFLQVSGLLRKLAWKKQKSAIALKEDKKELKKLIDKLPFKLTGSQKNAIEEILADLNKEKPMNRLLQGDVGSGKTVVAAIAAYISFLNGYQSIFMAPTQILAHQHYLTLKKVLSPFKVRVSLITSGNIKKDPGRNDIFVGTHALLGKNANFDDVGLIVIDEQHRFGVGQREFLREKAEKNRVPHVLTMTATPIPRTIALTLYNDLDLSTLDELPEGRQKIVTWIVPPRKRDSAYKWIKGQIKKDKVQAFVICPLIEESENELLTEVKSATKEYKSLKKRLPELKIGLLHGKIKAKEKEKTLDKFREGKLDILVATPVVEVGIDVPNATIMVVEGADRFGLAQLHQLRGRVGRGKKKSYCLLFSELPGEKAQVRLDYLKKTMSGFELAELDLKLRGPGEVFGTKQHGFPELKIASWSDTDLIKQTKRLSDNVVKNPDKYKALFEKIEKNSNFIN